jgi:pyruvate/2-oxoacid:ferredoxin oxidoreductase beta subunit
MSTKRTAKDFASSQEVRWCPGCGDYAILKAVTKALANAGADPESTEPDGLEGETVPTRDVGEYCPLVSP